MKLSSTIIFHIVCFLCAQFCISDSAKNCQQKLSNAENCLKQVMLIDENIQWPENLDSLNKYNRTVVKALKCGKQYRPCLKGFSRQVYTLMLLGNAKVIKHLFGPQMKPETALEHYKCIGSGVVPFLHKCMEESSKQFDYISHNTSDAELFPSICCVVHSTVNCFENSLQNLCKRKETVKFFSDLFAVLIGDVVDLSCSKQKTLEQCYANSKQVMDTLDSVANTEYKNVPFIVRPLLKIAERLSQ